MTIRNMSVSDIQRKVFGKSYDEVLLFLKHEDEKINRVLTALAFLTAAGVTLYIFSRPDRHAYADFPQFANAGVRIDDYFFGSFIVGVALSVALALVSLDPTSFLPNLDGNSDAGEHSLLYYRAIEERSEEEWHRIFEEEDLRGHYLRSLHADTHRLARRAVHKVRRFGTAMAVVQFTVAALALLGVTRLNHVSQGGRWILVTAILSAYTAMPLVDFMYFWLLRFPDVRRKEAQDAKISATRLEIKRLSLAMTYFLPFLVVAIVGLATHYRDWEPVTFALFGTLFLRLVVRLEWQRPTPWLQMFLMTSTAAGGAIWFWCS